MKTRKLGLTDLNLTRLGLGTFALGGVGWIGSWGPQDDKDSIDTILRAFDCGINWLDTAAAYGLGHSEEVVGKAIKGLSKRPIIATKCSSVGNPDGTITQCLKRESIRTEIEGSLKRLGIDAIDIYFIHWPVPDEDIEEGWSAVAELVKEGKVRYAAASNFSVAQLKRVMPIHRVAAIENSYSMIDREPEKELLDYCKQNNIGVVVWGPMGHGLLTGKFSRERLKNLDKEDAWRRNLCIHFKEPEASLNIELAEKLWPIAAKNGRTISQLALAWVLRRPEVTSAIVGARRPSQIEETAQAGDWELSKEDIAEIGKLLAEREKKLNPG
jgi:aryl-alcohol dehydrogenase-like predicted oxidoreductase